MKLSLPIGLFFVLLCSSPAYAQQAPVLGSTQSMRSLFLQLPKECTPGLNSAHRKTLIETDECEVSNHGNKDAITYTIDTATDNYLEYEYTNSSGEGSHSSFEIKRLVTSKGDSILLFAKNSDTRDSTTIYTLKVYNISGRSLTPNADNLLPKNLDYSIFLKDNTPTLVKPYIEETSLYAFDLNASSKDQIVFYITLNSDNDKKWLVGNSMVLTWTGSYFTGTIGFQKEEEEEIKTTAFVHSR